MTNKIQNIFLMLASLICLAPSLFFFMNTNEVEDGYQENRAEVQFNPKRPFDKIDEDYKYYFGFRRILSDNYLELKKQIFHTSPIPDKVIYGKDGWLFLGDSYNDVFSKSLGTKRFTDQEAQDIANKIIEMSQYCESIGVEFYYYVAPNSHTIYSDKLPLKPANKANDFDQIKQKLEREFPVLDIRPALRKAKQKQQVYQKTDSHWSEYGAYIGVNELLRVMQDKFPKIELIRLEDYVLEKTYKEVTDLAEMLKIKVREELIQFSEKNQTKIEVKQTIINGIEEIYTKNATGNYKGMIYRDSYAGLMIPFLRKTFRNLTFISSPRFDKQRIATEKPDFVIYEIVERNLNFAEL